MKKIFLILFLLSNRDSFSQDDMPYTFVEQMPEFPGADEALTKFLSSKYICPDKRKSGKIEFNFIVKSDGTTSDYKITKGISKKYDKEMLRVLSLMPKWKPGKQNSTAIDAFFNFYFEVIKCSKSSNSVSGIEVGLEEIDVVSNVETERYKLRTIASGDKFGLIVDGKDALDIIYKEINKSDYSYEYKKSDTILFVKNLDNRIAIYNINKGFISTFKFEYVEQSKEDFKIAREIDYNTNSLKYVILDKNYKELNLAKYSYISSSKFNDKLYFKVTSNNKTGVFDPVNMKMVIPQKYNSIEFNDTKIIAQLDYNQSTKGTDVYDKKFDFVFNSEFYISGCLLNYYKTNYDNTCYHLLDEAGKLVPNLSIKNTLSFSNYAYIQDTNNKVWFIQDKKLKTTPYKYTKDRFGYFSLSNGNFTKIVKFTDDSLEEILPFKYKTAEYLNPTRYLVSKDKKYGIIDKEENVIVPLKFDSLFLFDYYNDIIVYQLNKKFGLINRLNGKEITKNIYENGFSTIADMIEYSKAGKYGILNSKGKEVVPAEYSDLKNEKTNIYKVQKNDKFGMMFIDNSTYQIIIPIEYDELVMQYDKPYIEAIKGTTIDKYTINKQY